MWNTWVPQALYAPVAAPTGVIYPSQEQLRLWQEQQQLKLQADINHHAAIREHRAALLTAIQEGDVRGLHSLLLDTKYGSTILGGEVGDVYPLLVAGRGRMGFTPQVSSYIIRV